jgi:uncharacterized DUF497 family protein
MDVAYDPTKNAKNSKDRQLSFDRAGDLGWNAAHIRLDERHEYGEPRWIALGPLDGRLQVLVFSETRAGIRVISFRKANARERRAYEQAQATDGCSRRSQGTDHEGHPAIQADP